MNNATQQTSLPSAANHQAPLFLNTKEVMARYRISSTATLWKWRKNLGFPDPIHNGRFYNLSSLERWDQQQLSA
jgi:predicted DNA-binding transcriptional regulator AlpA